MARVLIVEDEEDIRLLARLLLRASHEIAEARTGEEGIRAARELAPDVVLLDLRLPDGDGWDVLAALRADGTLERMRVIMVSAHATADAGQRALAAGCAGYIMKPFTAAELLTAIERALS